MQTYIRNIVFSCPDPPALGSFYAELLGMRVLRQDWFVIARDENTFPRLAFGDGEAEYRPPRWPDPEHPQQLHLDFPAGDLEAAEALALRLGATPLQNRSRSRTYADPAGHPFCLYQDAAEGGLESRSLSGRIGHIVYDCFSPRSLSTFYEELLDMRTRERDTERLVLIGREDGSVPKLAFQHAQFPAPRWPDPTYPQQLHLDIHVDDGPATDELVRRLGAIPLPAMGGSCPVYADPAAHPFCLCAPGQ
jgi:catechol 2,3-dioxygenase-like lactoylglutathione lyase family enzyme